MSILSQILADKRSEVDCAKRRRPEAELRKQLDKAPAIRITFGIRNAPESWRDYLYWNMELDES